MSQNDQVNFKVFLKRGGDIEVRRFSVGADVVTNFLFLREKLQSLFPFLRDNDFKITWTGKYLMNSLRFHHNLLLF